MKAQIGNVLYQALIRNGLTQKAIAIETKLSKSTVNNYINNSNIRPNEATDIADTINDSEFSMEIGHLFLGIIKNFTGDRFARSLPAVNDFDEIEEAEEKRAYVENGIQAILASGQPLNAQERKRLQEFAFEKLDSTVMDLTLLTMITEKLDITLMELFAERMPYYKEQHYMRKDEQVWHKDSH